MLTNCVDEMIALKVSVNECVSHPENRSKVRNFAYLRSISESQFEIFSM